MFEALRKTFVDRAWFGAPYWVCLSALGLGFVFGGGSRQWLPSEFVCQVFGLVFLAAALAQFANDSGSKRLRLEIGLAALVPLIPLIQLVPLPPFAWSSLPGRSALVQEFMAARGSLPWQPISLSAEATWQAMLSLCAPLAVFVSALLLTFEERRSIGLLVLGFAGFSIVLAMLQLVGGPDSGLRFYAITNDDLPVGFFANRNHFSAFLYCILPLAAAWIVALGLKVGKSRRSEDVDNKRLFAWVLSIGAFAGIVLMQGLIHSRAGLLITILSACLSFCLALPFRDTKVGTKAIKGMAAALVIAVVLMGFYAISGIISQFDRDPIDDARFTILRGALKALWTYFPVGSGFGTFDVVYPAFETPSAATSEYVNRAHDDIVETLIEGGLFTILAAGLFAVWLARGIWGVWSAKFRNASAIDASLARAAAFVPVLLIFHCFADYPLRTVAIMSLFAFACALMVPPINEAPEQEASPGPSRRRTRRMEPRAVASTGRPLQ